MPAALVFSHVALYALCLGNRLGYHHGTLKDLISGQESVWRTIMVAFCFCLF